MAPCWPQPHARVSHVVWIYQYLTVDTPVARPTSPLLVNAPATPTRSAFPAPRQPIESGESNAFPPNHGVRPRGARRRCDRGYAQNAVRGGDDEGGNPGCAPLCHGEWPHVRFSGSAHARTQEGCVLFFRAHFRVDEPRACRTSHARAERASACRTRQRATVRPVFHHETHH